MSKRAICRFVLPTDPIPLEDVLEWNRRAKDHFVYELGSRCTAPRCRVRAGYRTVEGKQRRGSYNYTYTYKQRLLEFDHVTPVCNSNYKWRFAKLDFRKAGAWCNWQAYVDTFQAEAAKCRLRCKKHHARGWRAFQ